MIANGTPPWLYRGERYRLYCVIMYTHEIRDMGLNHISSFDEAPPWKNYDVIVVDTQTNEIVRQFGNATLRLIVHHLTKGRT